MSYAFVYSLNTDDNDDEYEQRTGVGVYADYLENEDGSSVVYRLTALVEDDCAGWSEQDFVRYWNERCEFWQSEVRNGCAGDTVGTTILRTWMGKQHRANACCIELAA